MFWAFNNLVNNSHIVFSLNCLIGIGNIIVVDIKEIPFSDFCLPVFMSLLSFLHIGCLIWSWHIESGHVTYLANGVS